MLSEEVISQTMPTNYIEFHCVAARRFRVGCRHVICSGLSARFCSDSGLWGRGSICCCSPPFWLVPSGHSQSLAWPFKEPTFVSSGACYYFHLLLLQQENKSIYLKVIFIPWIFTRRVNSGQVYLSILYLMLLLTCSDIFKRDFTSSVAFSSWAKYNSQCISVVIPFSSAYLLS